MVGATVCAYCCVLCCRVEGLVAVARIYQVLNIHEKQGFRIIYKRYYRGAE